MFRIDSPGATIANLFTEGNPALGIPATEVSADWLNDTVQEELINVVENLAGITLNKADNTQLGQALIYLFGIGGQQIHQDLLNNQAAGVDITGLLFDKTIYKGAQIDCDLYRQTDSSNLWESGTIYVTHDPVADVWRITWASHFLDCNCTFEISATGQVSYKSDNMAGANYEGKIRITNIRRFKQSL